MSDTHALLQAVNVLTTEQNGPERFREIQALLPLARSIGAIFGGERAVLNPLVELALEDADAFNSLMDLAETKRKAAGKAPLRGEEGPQGYDRTAYMREFMLAKRERERRAADIENMVRSEKDKLVGRSRIDFMQVTADKWIKRRDELLAAERERTGGKLPRDRMRELTQQFWATVDSELDELEEIARATMQMPASRKRK